MKARKGCFNLDGICYVIAIFAIICMAMGALLFKGCSWVSEHIEVHTSVK